MPLPRQFFMSRGSKKERKPEPRGENTASVFGLGGLDGAVGLRGAVVTWACPEFRITCANSRRRTRGRDSSWVTLLSQATRQA